jgi:hypothetical protein
LALTPEPASQLQLKRELALGMLKNAVPEDRFKKLEELVMRCQTTEEIDNALAYYRKLEVIRR